MKYSLNLTIFGGTGDLTFRKLLPALYNMSITGHLDPNSRIVIIGRKDYDSSVYREIAREWVEQFARLPYCKEEFKEFSKHLEYYQMDFSNPEAYDLLNQHYSKDIIGEHIFYFAVAPCFFGVIANGLAKVRGARDGKVIIEKPFGESLLAAKELNVQMERFFQPENIYRIDHYLGKEMVRNIQAIRFMNSIFSNIWNAHHIEYVQIQALEDVGVETRGGYYDASGALKDMVQNHLLQILSIVAMERPKQFYGPQMHEEQLKVLHALRPIDENSISDSLILGQYEGYREEPSVDPHSDTETYAALRLFIDNKRWKNTPFYIRTGKKLGNREMEVAIVFKRTNPDAEPNILIIKIQPIEGVHLQFNIKRPGDTDEIIETKMDFCQSCSDINKMNTPEAYERLLSACINKERSWFSRWHQIETSWNYVEDLGKQYREQNLPIYQYQPGTRGPKEAEDFLGRFGHIWFE